ncbi:MAG: alanine racemase [Erysipelotrichaceae bacterium]|nr:alanine racemase [Erysipelotrichaceae bacterium]
MYRNTYLKVNLSNYQDNLRYLQKISNKEIIAVIKANGYGLGDITLAKAAKNVGIRMVAVSSLPEALHIRETIKDMDILILGYVDKKFLSVVKENDLIIPTVSKDYIEEMDDLKGLRVHLKIDTGMNRIGIKSKEEAKEVLEHLLEKGASVEGIFTHYAQSDEMEEGFTKEQFERFKQIVSFLNYDFRYVHASNSDATINFREDLTNACRVGIAALGYASFDEGLKPTAELYSSIINIKEVGAGESIGYSRKYFTGKKEWIATVPIGYADGVLRSNTGNKVWVEGEACEIVGNVCMDQLMIRTDKYYPVNTPVEIFGQHQNIRDYSRYNNLIVYETLCLISDRITRVYVDDKGEIIEEKTPRF